MKEFTPINRPYIYGYHATRPDGLTIEIVRCYPSQWRVFLTRGADNIVACSIEAHAKQSPRGYLTYVQARRIAGRMFRSPILPMKNGG